MGTHAISERQMLQLREELLDSLDEEFELEMENRLSEDARRQGRSKTSMS